jgi:hypothetical protein
VGMVCGSNEASRLRISSSGLSTGPRLLRLAKDVRRLEGPVASCGRSRLRLACASMPMVRGLMKTVWGVTPSSPNLTFSPLVNTASGAAACSDDSRLTTSAVCTSKGRPTHARDACACLTIKSLRATIFLSSLGEMPLSFN